MCSLHGPMTDGFSTSFDAVLPGLIRYLDNVYGT